MLYLFEQAMKAKISNVILNSVQQLESFLFKRRLLHDAGMIHS